MQGRRVDDYWNIDGLRDLSGSCTCFTQFTLLEVKPPDRKMWSGWRLTKRPVAFRPDHFMARALDKIGKKREDEGEAYIVQWKTETRQCKKITRNLFHRPWAQFTESIKNARKKSKHGETRGKTNDFKSKFPCIWEASESTRLRMEESLPN